MSICTSNNKRFFANTSKLHWAWRKHECNHAANAHITKKAARMQWKRACPPTCWSARMHPSRHACRLTLVGLLIGLTLYQNMIICVCASVHKLQKKARAWGLFWITWGTAMQDVTASAFCQVCLTSSASSECQLCLTALKRHRPAKPRPENYVEEKST